MPMTERQVELVRKFSDSPIGRHFGMSLSYDEQGRAHVRLPYNPDLDHALGGIHGGIMATLLDTAAGGWMWLSPRDRPRWEALRHCHGKFHRHRGGPLLSIVPLLPGCVGVPRRRAQAGGALTSLLRGAILSSNSKRKSKASDERRMRAWLM